MKIGLQNGKKRLKMDFKVLTEEELIRLFNNISNEIYRRSVIKQKKYTKQIKKQKNKEEQILKRLIKKSKSKNQRFFLCKDMPHCLSNNGLIDYVQSMEIIYRGLFQNNEEIKKRRRNLIWKIILK